MTISRFLVAFFYLNGSTELGYSCLALGLSRFKKFFNPGKAVGDIFSGDAA
jgi:hypothetical protein